MKLYKITFKNISSITKIPDAQTIFGAVCNIIKQTKGEDDLNKYFNSFDSEPIFVHSSMFLDGTMPMVKVGLIPIEEKNRRVLELEPKEQLKYLSQLKKLKKINAVTLDIYNEYLVDGKFTELKEDIYLNKINIDKGILSRRTIKYDNITQLVTHNNHEEIESNERRLYYDNNIYFHEDCLFCIYVKTNNIEYVKDIFKHSQYFGFGSRVSVGKNCFEMVDINLIDDIKSNNDYKILLSKCVGDDFDLSDSSYVIDSSIYSGGFAYSSNVIGRFNRFVEGSYMKVKENKEYYGNLIECNNGKKIYHYGIGFTL